MITFRNPFKYLASGLYRKPHCRHRNWSQGQIVLSSQWEFECLSHASLYWDGPWIAWCLWTLYLTAIRWSRDGSSAGQRDNINRPHQPESIIQFPQSWAADEYFIWTVHPVVRFTIFTSFNFEHLSSIFQFNMPMHKFFILNQILDIINLENSG